MLILHPFYKTFTFTASPRHFLTFGFPVSIASLEDLPSPFRKVSVAKLTLLFPCLCPWSPSLSPSMHSEPQHTQSWWEARFLSGPTMSCTSPLLPGRVTWELFTETGINWKYSQGARCRACDFRISHALSKNLGAHYGQAVSESKRDLFGQSVGRVTQLPFSSIGWAAIRSQLAGDIKPDILLSTCSSPVPGSELYPGCSTSPQGTGCGDLLCAGVSRSCCLEGVFHRASATLCHCLLAAAQRVPPENDLGSRSPTSQAARLQNQIFLILVVLVVWVLVCLVWIWLCFVGWFLFR